MVRLDVAGVERVSVGSRPAVDQHLRCAAVWAAPSNQLHAVAAEAQTQRLSLAFAERAEPPFATLHGPPFHSTAEDASTSTRRSRDCGS